MPSPRKARKVVHAKFHMRNVKSVNYFEQEHNKHININDVWTRLVDRTFVIVNEL